MKRLFVLMSAALFTMLSPQASAQAQPRTQQQSQTPLVLTEKIPFGAGEELVYNVSYRAALIPNINIMRVSIRILAEDLGGTPHFHIVGNGRTTGAAKGILELNDTYHTWLDARTLLPSRTASDIREDSYRLWATYTYDWSTMTVSNVRRNPKWTADRRASFSLPDTNSGDALSLFYRLRALDVNSLKPGGNNRLWLVLSEDAKPIMLRFIGREDVKIRKVGTFRALRFTCTMATSDGSTYQEGMTFTAWISDDANHIPLMIESPIRIGRVSVTLAEGTRTIHSLESRVK